MLAIAILPSSGNALYLMQAECPGPQVGKLVPKGKNSALYLYLIYGALTFITIVLLFTGGMPLFDSVCHGMGIAGTGGFGIKNDGLSYYNSPYLDGVVTVTMLLFGVNFTLYYYMLIRRFREVRKNTELRVYFSIVAISTALIMLNIRPVYHSVGKCFRYAVFQVASIITSTGFATADYNQWPLFSQMLLILLMLIGACGGSTGGGFKVQRCVILWKSGSAAMRKMVHPNSVNQVKSDNKILRPEALHHVWSYLILYLGVLLASFLLLSLDDMDFGTAISAVITCTNNIGPGINSVGPMENFSFLSDFSKAVLSADMLLGRLEIFPILVLLAPSVWRKSF